MRSIEWRLDSFLCAAVSTCKFKQVLVSKLKTCYYNSRFGIPCLANRLSCVVSRCVRVFFFSSFNLLVSFPFIIAIAFEMGERVMWNEQSANKCVRRKYFEHKDIERESCALNTRCKGRIEITITPNACDERLKLNGAKKTTNPCASERKSNGKEFLGPR